MLVLSAFKDPSPLYKSSKRRGHLKPENFETLYLLSALQMPVKSVTSYHAEIKKLRRSLNFLLFLDFANLYSYFNVQMCSYFIVGNKIFGFFKKWVFAFLGEGTFQGGGGGGEIPPQFWGWLLIKGGGEGSDGFRIFGGDLGEVNISGWGWYPGGHYRAGRHAGKSICQRYWLCRQHNKFYQKWH